MVMHSAVVAMDASFPETAGCQNYAEINSWDHLQSQNMAALRTRTFEKWFFLPYPLVKVELSGAENQGFKILFK